MSLVELPTVFKRHTQETTMNHSDSIAAFATMSISDFKQFRKCLKILMRHGFDQFTASDILLSHFSELRTKRVNMHNFGVAK